MDPRYMRIEDDSDSSFSCGPTPPNPNNDNDTSCLLRLNPDTLQRDPLPVATAPWGQVTAPAPGLRNAIYEQEYEPSPPAPSALEPAAAIEGVINGGCLPDSLESAPALDLSLPRTEPVDTCDIIGGNIPPVAVDEERPESASSKETSSDGTGAENFHLLNTPLPEVEPQEKLLHPPVTAQQTADGGTVRELSYHEMQEVDDCFPSWNWPLVRNVCVGVNAAIWVGLLCVCIGLIVSMPRKCDPFRKWYQGHIMYEIFPGSFQDSDGDGIGDLRGVQDRLYYVKNLEANAVILTSLFETTNFPQNLDDVVGYTTVDPHLGTSGDFINLISDAHAMDIRIIISFDPVPLVNKSDSAPRQAFRNITSSQSKTSCPELIHVMEHWLKLGVDGFMLKNLDRVVDEVDIESLAQDVRNLLDSYTVGMDDRIVIAPLELMSALREHGGRNVTKVLHRVDLLDCHLEIHNRTPAQITEQINQIMSWDTSADTPWFNWRLASGAEERLSRRLGRRHTVGATLLQSLLPGTVTLLYGDEVCLMEADGERAWDQTGMSGLGIMPWSDDQMSADFTEASRRPWRPLPSDHAEFNIVSQANISIRAVRQALLAHRTAVPLYVNGIFQSVGDFNPPRTSNLKVRHVDDALVVLDRFYPRQPRWCVIYNTAEVTVERDLSHIFFRGLVMASSTGEKADYLRFKQLTLQPGEAVVIQLDR